MCGIVGYIGHQEAYSILIKGLHRLEYRGYDSAGVAIINPDYRLNIYKHTGKVAELDYVAVPVIADGKTDLPPGVFSEVCSRLAARIKEITAK